MFLKREILEIEYIFLNSFVRHIPLWPFRLMCYKLCGMKIGKGSRIMLGTRIVSPHKISIGCRTVINEDCYLDGRGTIKIGDDVTVATYSKLITGSHNIDDNFFEYTADSIVIQNNVAIFSDSLVLGGAFIENGCVFSARSLIRKGRYSSRGIYAGNPAVYIRERRSNLSYTQEIIHLLFR